MIIIDELIPFLTDISYSASILTSSWSRSFDLRPHRSRRKVRSRGDFTVHLHRESKNKTLSSCPHMLNGFQNFVAVRLSGKFAINCVKQRMKKHVLTPLR